MQARAYLDVSSVDALVLQLLDFVKLRDLVLLGPSEQGNGGDDCAIVKQMQA